MLYEDILRGVVNMSDLDRLGVTVRFRKAENAFFLILSRPDWNAMEPATQAIASAEVSKVMERVRRRGINIFLEVADEPARTNLH